jgi:microcin C transport system substrate-binding protein
LKDILRMAQFSRRHVLGLGVGALAAARLAPALADNGGKQLHGLSAFGKLKYPADFPNLAYVNPGAPKGGMFSQLVGSGGSTFNSLNAFIV